MSEANHPLLERARIGILISNRKDGSPIGVPVWFEWDGETRRCFADRTSQKITRLRRNPRASLLVTNDVGEPDQWIAFDGDFAITDKAGIEVAERIAAGYWDLNNPELKATLEQWKQAPEAFALLEMKPERIRRGNG